MIIKPIKTDQSAPVKFIIVGADRIVENGDTANKNRDISIINYCKFFFNTNRFNAVNKLSLLRN